MSILADRHEEQVLFGNFQTKNTLPITKYRNQLLFCLETKRTIILVSDTGTGKSTQVPQFIAQVGWGLDDGKKIICTQPRRIAALSLAERVSSEVGSEVGQHVGYSMRFEHKYSSNTRIKYATDGTLIREIMSDPLLSQYCVVMIDEAHERSLNTDILFGLLKKIKKKRLDLRIIVSSATIDATIVKNFFESNLSNNRELDDTCILQIEGNTYPIDICYLSQPTRNYLDETVDVVLRIHKYEQPGDILAFIPSGEDIDNVIKMLNDRYNNDDMIFLPLYSTLPTNKQMLVLRPTPKGYRKVIVATNIAETSLTIEGVKYVIDCGFVNLNYFNPRTGIDMLITTNISKASARQRAGRCGRTQIGRCFRLYREEDFDSFATQTIPEMQRVDISSCVLQLKALGINDVLHFDFISPPSVDSMTFALDLLFSLDAIDTDGNLTLTGEMMAEMPIEPKMSKTLLKSFDYNCSEEMLSIVAMSTVEYPFITQRRGASSEAKQKLFESMAEFASKEGDHLTLLEIYKQYVLHDSQDSWCDSKYLQPKILQRAKEMRKNLLKMIKQYLPDEKKIKSCGDDVNSIKKCLISGYFSNAARLNNDGKYYTLKGSNVVSIHPTSVYSTFGVPPPAWVIFNECIQSKIPQIRDLTSIQPLWLIELANHYYELQGLTY